MKFIETNEVIEGHRAVALVCTRAVKIKDGSGWGRAGKKIVQPGYVRAVALVSGEGRRVAIAELRSITGGAVGNRWRIAEGYATGYTRAVTGFQPLGSHCEAILAAGAHD